MFDGGSTGTTEFLRTRKAALPMPTTDRPIPKYRHYKPKDLAVVRIDGRDHYLGKYNSPESREKYHRLLAEHAIKGSVAVTSAKPPDVGSRWTDRRTKLDPGFTGGHVEAYYLKDGEPTTEVGVIRQVL